jgi:hypothetical protein
MIKSLCSLAKIIIISFLLIIPATVSAQEDTAISYSEVISVDSVSAATLYEKAKIWLINPYIDFRVELKVQDSAYGHVSGDGFCEGVMDHKDTKMILNSKTPFHFTIDIWAVDGKYKYVITDIYDELGYRLTVSTHSPVKYPLTGQAKSDRFWDATKKAFDRRIRERIEFLKHYMGLKDQAGAPIVKAGYPFPGRIISANPTD